MKKINWKVPLDVRISLGAALMLVVTSADLLYLYFTRHWSDQMKWIEYAEVACFFAFVAGGLLWSGFLIKRMIAI